MALSIDSKFKRHTTACNKGYRPSDASNDHWDCECNYSVSVMFRLLVEDGKIIPTRVRKTTGQWSKKGANAVIQAALDRGHWVDVIEEKKVKINPVVSGRHLISEIAKTFLDTRPARNIVVESVASYRPTINGFVSWCGKEMKRHVEDLAPCHAEDYMDSLTVSAATKINYFRRLRSFDKYCTMHFKTSFMAGLKALKPKHKDRPGFSEAQQKAILDGCLTLENAFEAQTFLYLMRYTGMAAGDAALFGDTDEMPGIVGDEVQYFRIKTQEDENRVLVKVPIPSWLLERLAVLKNRGLTEDGGKRYYFAHGRVINKHSVQQMWRNLLKPIFDAAGIKGTGKTTCPLHRFRHTFAKDMLTKWINGKDGRKYQIPLETVSLWLGHRSVATTRKHYSLTIQQRETAGSEMMREVYAQEAKKELAA